jgi:uncharacterized protein YbaA (DUF1428 family)
MAYIDGYVLAVKTHRRADYESMAKMATPLFKKHGALRVVETWGDDVPEGTLTSFPMAVKCEPDESVVFSWVWWPDKETRNSGMRAAMDDPEMKMPDDCPFDGKRMIFGGFEVMLEA